MLKSYTMKYIQLLIVYNIVFHWNGSFLWLIHMLRVHRDWSRVKCVLCSWYALKYWSFHSSVFICYCAFTLIYWLLYWLFVSIHFLHTFPIYTHVLCEPMCVRAFVLIKSFFFFSLSFNKSIFFVHLKYANVAQFRGRHNKIVFMCFIVKWSSPWVSFFRLFLFYWCV